MLAVTEPVRSARSAVQYNEQKVKQEQARFLDAHNFLQEKEELTIRDKLRCFRDLAQLNERTRKHCIHLSVNFPPKDELTDLQMKRIAADFMKAIDFGDQPWLLYRHVDAGHPHMHIVTVNIRPDGSRIPGDKRSPHYLQQTCFQLEQRHGLTPMFEMPDLFNEQQVTPQQKKQCPEPYRLVYGQKPTKNALAEVLEYVNQTYAFTCFDAYNAILSTYNVRADRGREDSPMYQNKGLYYRMIDDYGKKLGAPIKASAFPLPVTLNKLEQKFELCRQQVQERLQVMRVAIDYNLYKNPQPYSVDLFREDLKREGVRLIIPAARWCNARGWQERAFSLLDNTPPGSKKIDLKPDDGHGFIYIHRLCKIALRDTELGERYTAAAILERTGIQQAIRKLQQENVYVLSKAQKAILSPGYPDTAETRRLLLQMAYHQSDIVRKQLELKQELELTQRRSLRMRRGL